MLSVLAELKPSKLTLATKISKDADSKFPFIGVLILGVMLSL